MLGRGHSLLPNDPMMLSLQPLSNLLCHLSATQYRCQFRKTLGLTSLQTILEGYGGRTSSLYSLLSYGSGPSRTSDVHAIIQFCPTSIVIKSKESAVCDKLHHLVRSRKLVECCLDAMGSRRQKKRRLSCCLERTPLFHRTTFVVTGSTYCTH